METVENNTRIRVARAAVVAMAANWVLSMAWYSGLLFGEPVGWTRMVQWAPTLALILTAAWALGRPNTGYQLLGRVLVGAQVVPMLQGFAHGNHLDPFAGAQLGLAATALILAGRHGLDPDGGPFRPVRLRGLLMAVIVVLGLLAAVTGSRVTAHVITYCTIEHVAKPWELAARAGLVAVAYAVAAAGLYRLRTWALFLTAGIAVWFVANGFTGQLAYYYSDNLEGERMVLPGIAWADVTYGVTLFVAVLAVGAGILRARRGAGSPENAGMSHMGNPQTPTSS